MKVSIFLLVLTMVCSTVKAQDGLIRLDRKTNKPFIVDKRAYSFKERSEIFKNEDALKLLGKAKSKSVGAQILAGTGGGFLGYTLADVLLAKRKNYTEEQWNKKKTVRGILLGAGVLLIGVSIPIAKSAVRKVDEAVDIENNSIHSRSKPENSLKFEVGSNSIKLTFNF